MATNGHKLEGLAHPSLPEDPGRSSGRVASRGVIKRDLRDLLMAERNKLAKTVVQDIKKRRKAAR